MKILKGILILALCLAAGEVYVRIAERLHLTQVEVLKPESGKLLKEDRDFSADEDVRVLLLGDSMLAGLGVRHDQIFSTILEEFLRAAMPGKKVKVIDGMSWGFNTYRNWLTFERMMKKETKPTLIFYDYSLDDVYGGYPEFKDVPAEKWQGRPRGRFAERLRLAEIQAERYSVLMRYLIPRTRLYFQKKGIVCRNSPMGHLLHEAYAPDFVGWQATQKYLLEINRQCRENGIVLLVHHSPDLMFLPDDPFSKITQIVRDFCRDKGMLWLDSAPAFRGYAAKDLTLSPLDAHPSPLAHRIAAAFAAQAILEHDKVLSS
ncbi:MAG TPA: hypothetical protein VL688_09550 [Verrucomicrobiae bacterium]|nr:hypothetical protein [Verrucomicrobiae bacterium]